MSPHRLPRPIRLALYALASALLLTLCIAPQDSLPETGTGDKVEHLIAWFVLTATGYVLAPNRPRAIPAYAIAFGLFVELLQVTMGFGRHGDWRDFAMDAAGVAIATTVYLAVRARGVPQGGR